MTSGAIARDWQQILARRSFLEGDALDRAKALLDPDGVRVLCGPFDRSNHHGWSPRESCRRPTTVW